VAWLGVVVVTIIASAPIRALSAFEVFTSEKLMRRLRNWNTRSDNASFNQLALSSEVCRHGKVHDVLKATFECIAADLPDSVGWPLAFCRLRSLHYFRVADHSGTIVGDEHNEMIRDTLELC
jgi:hypothetical protein